MDRGQRARTGGDRERGDAEDAARDPAHSDSERFRFAVLRVDAERNLAYADMDRSGDAGGVLVDGHRLDEFPTQCSDDHVRRLHAGAERGQGAIARYGRCDHGGGTVHIVDRGGRRLWRPDETGVAGAWHRRRFAAGRAVAGIDRFRYRRVAEFRVVHAAAARGRAHTRGQIHAGGGGAWGSGGRGDAAAGRSSVDGCVAQPDAGAVRSHHRRAHLVQLGGAGDYDLRCVHRRVPSGGGGESRS